MCFCTSHWSHRCFTSQQYILMACLASLQTTFALYPLWTEPNIDALEHGSKLHMPWCENNSFNVASRTCAELPFTQDFAHKALNTHCCSCTCDASVLGRKPPSGHAWSAVDILVVATFLRSYKFDSTPISWRVPEILGQWAGTNDY